MKEIVLPEGIDILGEEVFSECRTLTSVLFGSDSRLSRIESRAFRATGLMEIIIPASVEFIGERSFAKCEALSSVRFEPDSQLRKIEKHAFSETGLVEIILPASVEFLGESFLNHEVPPSETVLVVAQGGPDSAMPAAIEDSIPVNIESTEEE
ncbi:MAG: leucine-rich repeat domain-containing protein [Holosporales bacterium]|nr:leucine-rich repeat domain-containing protein [Holosporales bacterium]